MKINKNVTWSINRNPAFIEKISDNKRIVLNESSLFIWRLVLSNDSEEEILKQCIADFPDADINQITEDVHDFIEFLVREEIIEVL